MESSLKLLRTVRMAMLASILFYGVLAERMTRISKSASSPFFYSVLVVSVFMVGTAFVLRRFIFSRSENVLAAKPDDKGALLPWLIGYMTTFALCEAVALLGFVLRVTGSEFFRAIPFYVAGFLLLLYFAPRRPSNAIG